MNTQKPAKTNIEEVIHRSKNEKSKANKISFIKWKKKRMDKVFKNIMITVISESIYKNQLNKSENYENPRFLKKSFRFPGMIENVSRNYDDYDGKLRESPAATFESWEEKKLNENADLLRQQILVDSTRLNFTK